MARPKPLKAPFPYFGGKSAVAALVWGRLGAADNFIEPFFGSGAVLLLRPEPRGVETVNDADDLVVNFWRAVRDRPDEVAAHADRPVHEAELRAAHRWLVLSDDALAFRRRVRNEVDFSDAKVAGLWCWGLCAWIGGGWCTVNANGSDSFSPGRRPRAVGEFGTMPGVHGGDGKMPRMTGGRKGDEHYGGLGVDAELPLKQGRPQLADAYDIGRGVNASPSPSGRKPAPTARVCDNGVLAGSAGTCADRRAWLLDWFGRLADRLRNVRTLNGDWLRCCDSESVTTRLGVTGIFLDPPYAKDVARMHAWLAHLRGDGPEPAGRVGKANSRHGGLYATDGRDDADRLVARVHAYCAERGADPKMRIALAGYEGEHESLVGLGWREVAWTAQGGYGNRSVNGKANARRERLWFSPHCERQPGLFDALEALPAGAGEGDA